MISDNQASSTVISGSPWILTGLTLLSVAVFLLAVWPKWRVLQQAPRENRFDRPVQRLWNTLQIAFLQTKMFKETAAGWMHAFIFWGFLVLLFRAAEFFFIGFFPTVEIRFPGSVSVANVYSLIKDGFVVLVILACLYALYRRLMTQPKRLNLSGEGILILVLILLIMLSDVLFAGAEAARFPQTASGWGPLGWGLAALGLNRLDSALLATLQAVGYWVHVVSILFFIDLLPRSKHFHIVTSIPNVYFSNVTGRVSAPQRLDFEEVGRETFGVTRIEEFSWKKLLDFHTCTECGRCDVFCPALNSGKPLSPKQFTIDLRDHLNQDTPRLLSGSSGSLAGSSDVGAGTGAEVTLMGGAILDETVWSCTTCGACEEECPVMIEFVNKMIDLRQGLVMMDGRYPKELVPAFKSLETHSNPWGFPSDQRASWAEGLGVKQWDKNHPTEYLYFVGCNGAFDTRGKQVAESVVTALQKAGVDFSILGNREGCTGDPARRLGNEYLFDMLAVKNAATFKDEGILKIVTHCPHCFNSLKNEYPEFGAHLDVIHHSELLARLIREQKISVGEKSKETVVYHDSCYMGRHNKQYEAPRTVLQETVVQESLREVDTSRERGTCCGAGGARFLLEETTGSRMSHNRVDELMQTNPDIIAVSCPFCILMLEDALKAKNLADKVKVKDISELL